MQIARNRDRPCAVRSSFHRNDFRRQRGVCCAVEKQLGLAGHRRPYCKTSLLFRAAIAKLGVDVDELRVVQHVPRVNRLRGDLIRTELQPRYVFDSDGLGKFEFVDDSPSQPGLLLTDADWILNIRLESISIAQPKRRDLLIG